LEHATGDEPRRAAQEEQAEHQDRDEGCDRRECPEPAAGRVAATKGGSQQMNRIPVSSNGITEVGYHQDTDTLGTLELKFSNGGVYEFFNVPTTMYNEFIHAPSGEDYYFTNIGKRFPCTRVA
jgi:KTSC domain